MGEKSKAQLEQELRELKGHKPKKKKAKVIPADQAGGLRRLTPVGVDPITGQNYAEGRKKAKRAEILAANRHKKDKVTGKGSKKERSLDPKQIRARIRRRGYATDEEMVVLYGPLSEWSKEELARGIRRDKQGAFKPVPEWFPRSYKEQIAREFQKVVKGELDTLAIPALATLKELMEDDTTDDNGKPVVPANVKASIAQYLIEHVVGKPKVHVEADISVKLQAILAGAVVTPGASGGDIGAGHGFPVVGMTGFVLGAGSAPVADEDVIDVEGEEYQGDGS